MTDKEPLSQTIPLINFLDAKAVHTVFKKLDIMGPCLHLT